MPPAAFPSRYRRIHSNRRGTQIMRLSGASRIFVAVACSLFLAGSMKFSRLAAQDEPATRQELVESLQITANDEIAAEDVAGHHVHLHPLRSRDASRGRYKDKEVRRGNPRQEFANGESSSANSALSTVPGVPAPGFYPADLSNPAHGRVLTTTRSEEHTSELQSHVNLVCRLL